jgi:hypothetical protein
VAFAVAVHEPVQSALHFVVQSAVVGTDTHCVLQWSSQHELHDAWQSVDEDDDEEEDVPPSGDVPEDEDEEELDVQDELHPDSQRDVQSVVQSRAGGLVEQLVEQLDWQLETQLASADAEHFESHCFSSFAAHASSHAAEAQCVEQLLWRTRLHCALASTSMFPHAEIVEACAARGNVTTPAIVREATARGGSARRTRLEIAFMPGEQCNR